MMVSKETEGVELVKRLTGMMLSKSGVLACVIKKKFNISYIIVKTCNAAHNIRRIYIQK